MKRLSLAALLIAALTLPVVLFLGLWLRGHAGLAAAALVGVAMGWALNVAWAFASERGAPAQEAGNTVSIALRFGWACPAVLVLLAWGGWRLAG